jgi:hypothetical protein
MAARVAGAAVDWSAGTPAKVAADIVEESTRQIVDRNFDLAALRLGLGREERLLLKTPFRELTVKVPVRMDDGSLKVFVGHRVQHSVSSPVACMTTGGISTTTLQLTAIREKGAIYVTSRDKERLTSLLEARRWHGREDGSTLEVLEEEYQPEAAARRTAPDSATAESAQ